MSSQSICTPAARAMAGRWITWLVEPPVASRPTIALTMAFLIDATPQRAIVLAVPGDLGDAVDGGARQLLAAAWCRAGTKLAPGMCRPIVSIII